MLFPSVKRCKIGEAGLLCPAERVIALYNRAHPTKDAKKISKGMRYWFESEALKEGWKKIEFLREVQSARGAGAVLWKKKSRKP